MKQQGLFDDQICYDRLDKTPDPLIRLKDSIDWEIFRPDLEALEKTGSGLSSSLLCYNIIHGQTVEDRISRCFVSYNIQR